MDKGLLKKKEQLGIPFGTACGRLRKTILFKLVKQCELNFCFVCGKEIETEKELSIEHKIPWLDSKKPTELFFDLDNIAFSHLKCNISNARQPEKGKRKHPSHSAYDNGCRCGECKELHRIRIAKYRKNKSMR